jgi:hypothetical protein
MFNFLPCNFLKPIKYSHSLLTYFLLTISLISSFFSEKLPVCLAFLKLSNIETGRERCSSDTALVTVLDLTEKNITSLTWFQWNINIVPFLFGGKWMCRFYTVSFSFSFTYNSTFNIIWFITRYLIIAFDGMVTNIKRPFYKKSLFLSCSL